MSMLRTLGFALAIAVNRASSRRTGPSRRTLFLATASLLFVTRVQGTAGASQTPENLCEMGRIEAASKYASGELKEEAKSFGNGAGFQQAGFLKYRVKYAAVWAKLQAKATGTGVLCDGPRFFDNGDGTVTDNLTGLQWEKKTNLDGTANLSDPHDADNLYSWSVTDNIKADGTAFTSALASLNNSCFAGHCDWRLPTLNELQTILADPCTTGPCIDQSVFGATAAGDYWLAVSILRDPNASTPWAINFTSGNVEGFGNASLNFAVRAVRDGL
jgi:hypothetical protein